MLSRALRATPGLLLLVGLLVVAPATANQSSPGPQVRLLAASFDPLQGRPAPHADGDSELVLVQFHGPIKSEWKLQLTAVGAELLDYIPEYAFVARMNPDVAAAVAKLPVVRWVGPYRPAYRLSPALRQPDEPGGSTQGVARPVDVRISAFPGQLDRLRADLMRAGHPTAGGTETPFGGTLRAVVAADLIAGLARSPAVRWIEPAPRRRLLNDVARSRQIMDADRVWELGLFGRGQVVAFADSGLDVGNAESLSADFRGRVLAAHPLGAGKTTWNDPVGHGTHVGGSIAGSGALSGSDAARHRYAGSLAGIAPEAALVVQAFDVNEQSGEIEGLPDDLNVLFQQAYDDGARVHSNSWGGSDDEHPDNPFGGYTLDARQADEFAWAHRDLSILFAAGNAGTDSLPEGEFFPGDGKIDPDSMNIPGTAKNVITVGASESLRPPGGDDFSSRNMQWIWVSPFDFLHPPIAFDFVSDNANGMAAFSSRGPTDDGRIKPDVVAPGTNIVSARSRDPGFEPFLESWGVYEENASYVYNAGTSMATPLVAGAAALVRQWYNERRGLPNPSSALVKATLIHGAIELTPGQYGTGATQEIPPRPNAVEGWGRVSVHRSLVGIPPRLVWFDDHAAGLQTGAQVIYDAGPYQLQVVNFAAPLQVTLAWTDYPGSPAAARQLVNDLDLIVIGPDGRVWHGNGIAGDRTNNVEGVEITRPALGQYRIIVHGHNVPQGPQPYALVVAGGLTTEGLAQVYLPMIAR